MPRLASKVEVSSPANRGVSTVLNDHWVVTVSEPSVEVRRVVAIVDRIVGTVAVRIEGVAPQGSLFKDRTYVH